MRFSSLLLCAAAAVDMLCGLGGTAISQTATGAAALPGVMVEAPKHTIRPEHGRPVRSASFHGGHSRRASPASQTPSASDPVGVKLARLEKATGNCVDGCQTSFKSGNRPWIGCSTTAWPMMSSTCRNAGNYKTYAECVDAGLTTGWRNNDVGWYCSSLGLK